MKALVSSHLHQYTRGASELEARGGTISEVLSDLDRQFPGLRFRLVDEQDKLRPHMNLFVNDRRTRDLTEKLAAGDVLHVLGSLSGG